MANWRYTSHEFVMVVVEEVVVTTVVTVALKMAREQAKLPYSSMLEAHLDSASHIHMCITPHTLACLARTCVSHTLTVPVMFTSDSCRVTVMFAQSAHVLTKKVATAPPPSGLAQLGDGQVSEHKCTRE